MKEIDDLNFSLAVRHYLKKYNINTIDDLLKADYDLILWDKDISNAVFSRMHTENKLFDFEIPYYEVLKRKIKKNQYIKIDELFISNSTKSSLNKLNVRYLDELAYLDMDSISKLKKNELGEILYLMELFNIKLADKYNDGLIYLNQNIGSLILSTNTIFELRAMRIFTVSDYIHANKDDIRLYLSECTINEIENKICEFSNVTPLAIELEVNMLENEVKNLEQIALKKQQNLNKLIFLINKKDKLQNEIKDNDAAIKRLIKSQKD